MASKNVVTLQTSAVLLIQSVSFIMIDHSNGNKLELKKKAFKIVHRSMEEMVYIYLTSLPVMLV